MYSDDIISEVWRNRETYMEKHHHDLERMIEDLKKRQEKPHSIIVDRRVMENNSFQENVITEQ